MNLSQTKGALFHCPLGYTKSNQKTGSSLLYDLLSTQRVGHFVLCCFIGKRVDLQIKTSVLLVFHGESSHCSDFLGAAHEKYAQEGLAANQIR